MRPTNTLAAAMLTLLLAPGVVSCGGDDPPTPTAEEPVDQGAEVHHIHGLGVTPDDGTLYVATHSGLFEAADGTQELRRIGDGEQDIMGFSVVAPDRFIGSGHPDPSDANSPPNLGLIESRDGGKTWTNISLHGEADFHVLQSSGDRIYGFNGIEGRVLVSSDGGRRWEKRTPPAALYDLAIDPREPDHIVASTERGVFPRRTPARRGVRCAKTPPGYWPGPPPIGSISSTGKARSSTAAMPVANGSRPAASPASPPRSSSRMTISTQR
jgi:hypothetical protein